MSANSYLITQQMRDGAAQAWLASADAQALPPAQAQQMVQNIRGGSIDAQMQSVLGQLYGPASAQLAAASAGPPIGLDFHNMVHQFFQTQPLAHPGHGLHGFPGHPPSMSPFALVHPQPFLGMHMPPQLQPLQPPLGFGHSQLLQPTPLLPLSGNAHIPGMTPMSAFTMTPLQPMPFHAASNTAVAQAGVPQTTSRSFQLPGGVAHQREMRFPGGGAAQEEVNYSGQTVNGGTYSVRSSSTVGGWSSHPNMNATHQPLQATFAPAMLAGAVQPAGFEQPLQMHPTEPPTGFILTPPATPKPEPATLFTQPTPAQNPRLREALEQQLDADTYFSIPPSAPDRSICSAGETRPNEPTPQPGGSAPQPRTHEEGLRPNSHA